jgi:hypothetical protein
MLLAAAPSLAGEDPRGLAAAWRFVDPEGDGAATRVELADVDGDGRQDVLVFDPVRDPNDPGLDVPGRVQLFLRGANFTGAPDLTLGDDATADGGWSASPGSWGDINGDGAADQLTWVGDPGARDRTLQVRLGRPNGPAALALTVTVDDASVPWRYGAKVPTGPLVDVNGDGRADALLRAHLQGEPRGAQHLSLHLGSPRGLTPNAAWRGEIGGPTLVDASVHVVGDVDADGFRDLVWVSLDDIGGGAVAGSLTLTRGDEDGFRDVTWTSLLLPAGVSQIDGYSVIDAGDLNQDGRDDVLVLVHPDDAAAESRVLYLAGDVNYGFALVDPPVLWRGVQPLAPSVLGVADFDGDALLDLALGMPSTPGGQVVLQREALGWIEEMAPQLFPASPGDVGFGAGGTVGDVDGDGRADLVVVSTGGPGSPGAVELFLGFTDDDLDGADDLVDDCDPTEATVHPGAAEAWYDGVDQDCDGNDADQDGDGAPYPDDCDDLASDIHFGAIEFWYDGVDQDCDGNDGDQDGDGAPAAEVGGEDCDDADGAVHPDAEDLVDNGVDEDCDGADATAATEESPGCGCAQGGGPSGLFVVGLVVMRRRGSRAAAPLG